MMTNRIRITFHTILSLSLAALCMAMTACTDDNRYQELDNLYTEATQLLNDDRLTDALPLISQGISESSDSAWHYRFECLKAKYFFITMQSDSFLLSNQRLGQFLSKRQTSRNNKLAGLLEKEYLMQKAVYHSRMTLMYDSAHIYYKKTLDLIGPPCKDNISQRLTTLTNIADAYKMQGQYDKAVRFFKQAMDEGDLFGIDNATRISIAIGIASAFTAMGSFDQSTEWWQMAEELEPEMNRNDMFVYLNNRGNCYFLQKQFDKSLDLFKRLDNYLGSDSLYKWQSMFCKANISDNYLKLNMPDKAEALLAEVEPFFKEKNLHNVVYHLITQRIELAMLRNNPQEALTLARQPFPMERILPEQKILRLDAMKRLYNHIGDYRRCTEAMQDYEHLHDSIAGTNMQMQFAEALSDYRHNKELTSHQQKAERERLALWIAMATAMVAIVLLSVRYYLMNRKKKLREQEMRNHIQQLRMEAVRNRITPHFMSNALTHHMQARQNGEIPDLDSLAQLLHRGLEMSDNMQNTLAQELRFIDFYTKVEGLSVGTDFVYATEISTDVDPEKVVLPAMTIQILVENAIKHGLKKKQSAEGKCRFVKVKASKTDDGTLIEVVDNGDGIPQQGAIRMGTGTKVLHQTIHLLNEQNNKQMDYGIENACHADGSKGCRSWVFLPDDYTYILKCK